ncbi:MAG: hypothetical protein RLZZ127_1124 [Planctomycetota bacterium]|jgi:cytochrome c-type protein NapB
MDTPHPRWWTVAGMAVVAVALVGFVVGLGHPAPAWTAPERTAPVPVPGGHLPAVTYAEMDGKARGPNRDYRSRLETLVEHRPGVLDPVQTSAASRAAAVAARALRRAYNGAPPVIPHPVLDTNEVASCFQCHGDGRIIDGLIAPKMSHQPYTNCTQCHAPVAVGTPGITDELVVPNGFVGAPSAGRGPRAYPGAPPQIPHSTHMRENCMSCHGLLGSAGLRTPHPDRVNCQQCHAPAAHLDQRRFDAAIPPGDL